MFTIHNEVKPAYCIFALGDVNLTLNSTSGVSRVPGFSEFPVSLVPGFPRSNVPRFQGIRFSWFLVFLFQGSCVPGFLGTKFSGFMDF